MKLFRLSLVATFLALLALLSAASIVRAQSSDERFKQESLQQDDAAKEKNSSKTLIGLPTDWSHHHLIYSNTTKLSKSETPLAKKLQAEPRFRQALARRTTMTQRVASPNAAELGARAELPPDSVSHAHGATAKTMTRDWTAELTSSGGGTVGNEQYPAKYSQYSTVTSTEVPSCTTDFVVYNNNQYSNPKKSSGPSTNATDSGFFSGIPAAGSTITIAGVVFTAVTTTGDTAGNGTPSYYQGTSATQAATDFVAAINVYATKNAGFTYHAVNTGFFGGGAGTYVTVTDTTAGAAGNATVTSPWGCFTFSFFGFHFTFGPNCPAGTTTANFDFFTQDFTGGRGSSSALVANLIGYNYLYTGSNPTGMCNTAISGITITAPNVMFAYGVSTNGGVTTTSPALSETGTQIAVVESTPTCVNIPAPCNIGSVLHLIKWAAPTVTKTNYSATIPATVIQAANSTTAATYRSCVATTTTPCMWTITISASATDSNSAPFIDYTDDVIYVGDDAGVLHKFLGVFVGTPSSSASWSTTVDAGEALTGPVYDTTSGNIYVADALGYISIINSSGGLVQQESTNAGTGAGGFPIPDPPIVDGAAETVAAFVSNDGTGGADLDQFIICTAASQVLYPSCTINGPFASSSAPQIGPAGVQMHDGDFDNSYYSGTYQNGYLYFCGKTPGTGTNGVTSGTDVATIERANFDVNGVLINVDLVSAPLVVGSTVGVECSPLTEAYNPTGGAGGTPADFMFFSVQAGGVGTTADDTECSNLGDETTGNDNPTSGCVMSIIVNDDSTSTATAPTAMPASVTSAIGEPGGSSGIIIDWVAPASTYPQAQSIYFSPLALTTTGNGANGNCAVGVGCAVKATQSALQ
jgi:hypothetical protein